MKTKKVNRTAKDRQYTMATLDAETDPFEYGRIPVPFAWGLYTGDHYYELWGDDCTDKLIELLASIPDKLMLYAHNGGKFDFYYLLKKGVISDPIKIINGRIVSCKIGIHELRDSYAILPMPLAGYKKDDIDYKLFEEDTREDHKNDILAYLSKDCEYLYELVEAFIEEFGLQLTIGATSIKKIKEFHPFDNQNDIHDRAYRPYYFGGRVQCFERGLVENDLKIFDVNSMYPHVMANYEHPTGKSYTGLGKNDVPKNFKETGVLESEFAGKPYFIDFTGRSQGALCQRTKTGLDFGHQHGRFQTLSHELLIGLKYGLIEIETIHEIRVPDLTINFGLFVHNYIKDKIDAKKNGDKLKEILTKFLLNSGYGKFGQNPENFKEWTIRYQGEQVPNMDHWEMEIDMGFMELWTKPSPKPSYYDVATAASITSAARAVLLEALVNAVDPLYCDTDSIICSDIKGATFDPFKLGAWDLEGAGNKCYLAGKKLYALYQDETPVKYASKGVRLEPSDIIKLSEGETVNWKNEAPNFKLNGDVKFINRNVKMR